jgi:hypothetical protein
MVQLSRLGERGGRVVTYAGRDAVDANVPIDERRASRTGKSCGPGAPMQAPSLRGGLRLFEDDGGNKLVHRGEREVSRKPLRREGRREFRLYLCQRAHAQTSFCAWAVGAAGTRSSLRPRLFQRVLHQGSLGRTPSRERGDRLSALLKCLKQVRGAPEAPVRAARKITAPSRRARGPSLPGSTGVCHWGFVEQARGSIQLGQLQGAGAILTCC